MIISNASKHIFIKEFTSYFKTPIGYVFLVIFLFGIGYLTFEPGRGSFFSNERIFDDVVFFAISLGCFFFLSPL